ncbi:MAG: DNA polymerase/3'-5' exonuclease PolX [Planctomycetaceae bacterium]|nr:DNA polymerase/3'-5' exonuclease PolX [Planctomycetaceae bacterium]
MNNVKIADKFDQIADLLEFKSANPFRVRAYRRGARTIRDLSEPIAAILSDDERKLTDIDGIGKDLSAKCETFIETGKIPLLDELLEDIPRTVLDLLRVPGLGPKKAAAVYQELNVTTLDDLKSACESEQVRSLKGFGAKTEQAILSGLAIANAANQRILWSEADAIAAALVKHMNVNSKIQDMSLAGSYRRGKETVGDLDLLVVSQDSQHVMDRFAEFPEINAISVRGETKMSVRLESGFQIDLRVVPHTSFGAALQYFTGSKEHNVALRGLAKKKGLKINEYGVYKVKSDTYVAGETEAEVYSALDLPWIPPELREARIEFENDEACLPELIELSDIRGDLHMHTNATDGKATLSEMVSAAKSQGLKYIAITDHSQRVSMANGLDPQRLLEQWAAIDAMNQKEGKAFKILKGIECDILEQGGMDLPDEILRQADWVLASIHYGQKQSRQQITDRLIGAIQNPHVSAIAHPTGRLINRREAYDVDLDAVMNATQECGKLLELNANPRRLDLNEINCAHAKRLGIPIVINTDAHSVEGLSVMRYGLKQARRGGLTKKDVANTWTWPQLKKLIGRNKNVS